jgi:hypothetical protein
MSTPAPSIAWKEIHLLITTPGARMAFAKLVDQHRIPLAQQPALAAMLMHCANEQNQGKMSWAHVMTYGPQLIKDMPEGGYCLLAGAVEDIQANNNEWAFRHAQKKFFQAAASLYHNAREMISLKRRYPEFPFELSPDERRLLNWAEKALRQLNEKF